MRYKPDWEAVKKRLTAFWQGELEDRVCISVMAPAAPGAEISMFRNPDPDDSPEALLRYWTDPDTLFENNLRRIQGTYLGGDTLPVAFSNFGTSGHCNYYGAKPAYGHDTIWFDPAWHGLADAERAVFDEALLARHLELTRGLAERANDLFFVSMPDHTGTIDAIGHLYGTEALLVDMLTEPEQVGRAVKVVNQGWRRANEAFYQCLAPFNQGGATHAWMHLWAPGRVQHMQADISVMISAGMYEELILPELEEQLRWIDYPVYHFDGIEQAQHLEYILSLEKLRAIQWTHVAGQASAIHHLPVLRRIQKAGKGLIIMTPAEDVPALMANLDHHGLYLHAEETGPDKARQLVDYAAANTRRSRL